jgi:TolB-like protein
VRDLCEAPIVRGLHPAVSKDVQIFSKAEAGKVSRNQRSAFGPFEFDIARSLLFRDGTPVQLGRRGRSLLGVLLIKRGDVVSKAELMEAAWPGVHVEEGNLSVQIGLLRRALGRTASGGEWIITAQTIGYRFRPAADPRPEGLVPTVAILRFTDFETGAQAAADGVAEDLTTALSRFGSLRILARTTSFAGGDGAADSVFAARRLGANYSVEGSVRRVDTRLRLNTQLIDAKTGHHIWADTIDESADWRSMDHNILRIAASIDAAIRAAETERSRVERPDGSSARDLYLRAQWHLRPSTEAGNAAAFALFERALRLEPDNIRILALGAEILHHRASVGWPALGPDDERMSRELTSRGLALGTQDGAALGLFATSMFSVREWDTGRVTMERAVDANPASAMGLGCAGLGSLWLGETAHAARYYERAAAYLSSDPTPQYTLNGLAVVERRRGNYEAAVDLTKRAIAAAPGHSGAHWNLIAAMVGLGRLSDARRYVTRYRAISPTSTVANIKRGQPMADERFFEPVLDALATAGLPEG